MNRRRPDDAEARESAGPLPICIVCGDAMLTNYRQRRYCTRPGCQAVKLTKTRERDRRARARAKAR